MNNEVLEEELEDQLLNINKWIDPYDSETISSRYPRGIAKRVALFYPSFFYKANIFKRHEWDENYIMLGQTALNLKRKDLLELSLTKLGVGVRQYWGLPIAWHSGKYIFQPGTLMSTTTSECILFLMEVNSKYPDLIKPDYLECVALNLIKELKKNYLPDSHQYLYSYTPDDEYQVFNSNLLVSAAIGVVGSVLNNKQLVEESSKIAKTCAEFIPKSGFVPYSVFGPENTADSYHQLFSMRAVFYLKKYNLIDLNELTTLEKYFSEVFNVSNNIVLKPNSTILDLQPFAEALRYYAVVGEAKMFDNVYKNSKFLMKNNKYIQRVWFYKSAFRIKSNVCYSRQGSIRLLLARSYRENI